MQDDSNLRQPPPPHPEKCLPSGHVFIKIKSKTPKNKSLLGKNLFILISHISKCHAALKIGLWKKSHERKLSATSAALCSLLRISWSLKMGPTGCPKMSVGNITPQCIIIPQQRTYHVIIWL
jgi:hypothetical protein